MQIDEGKRGFGLTGVDCKGFDPLNRSTCSSGITGGGVALFQFRCVGIFTHNAIGSDGTVCMEEDKGTTL